MQVRESLSPSRLRGRLRLVGLVGQVGEGRGWHKFRNTFLRAPWLFALVVRDRDFDVLLAGRGPAGPVGLIRRLLEKALWFWPRIVDAGDWARGEAGRLQTPLNYMDLDASSEVLLQYVKAYSTLDSAVLDVGCNCGRDLNALYQAGYRDLSGVDAMGAAISLFRAHFAQAAAASNISHDLFQRFLARQPENSYDLVYSHGATLELVHPSFDIVKHISRIARKHVVLFLNEHAHAYPRFWIFEFRRQGFYLVNALRPAGQLADEDVNASLLVFQRIEQ